MSEQQEQKAKLLDLRDPELVAKLENAVFNGVETAISAKMWLACLALLLVSKQDEDKEIQMDINGIRVAFILLPPGEDMKETDDEDEDEDEDEAQEACESLADAIISDRIDREEVV